MVKTLGNYNVNLRKVLTGYGFYVSVAFTILLLALSSIYSTGNYDSYSAIRVLMEYDRDFMLNDTRLCSYSVVRNSTGGWFSMFIPIISAFAFVPIICDEYDSGSVRFNIFRSSKLRYHISKFIIGSISGGLAVLAGFIVYTVFVYSVFPDISQYSPENQSFFEQNIKNSFPHIFEYGYIPLLLLKSLEIFIYGFVSSALAVLFTSFIRNKYLVMCIPFFVKYVVTQTCTKFNFDAMVKQNMGVIKLSNIINPDSVLNLYLYNDYRHIIIIYNIILWAVLFAVYIVISGKRVDCGE